MKHPQHPLWMRTLIALTTALALLLPGAPLVAEQPSAAARADNVDAAHLIAVMRLDALMPILQGEAVKQAEEGADTMFGPGAGPSWAAVVARLNDPARLERLLRAALDRALAGHDPRLIAAALDFYGDPLGQKLTALELSARRALLTPGAPDAARAALRQAEARRDPRLGAIRRLIADADLVESNVAASMNAAFAFTRAYAEGGGYGDAMDQALLLEEARAREDEIRADTVVWLESYLLLAYSPVTDAEMEEYTAFSTSPAGRAVSKVLFAAFEALFSRTARDSGAAAAAMQRGEPL